MEMVWGETNPSLKAASWGNKGQAEKWEPTKETKERVTKTYKDSQEHSLEVRELRCVMSWATLSHLGKQNEFFPEYTGGF